MRKFIRYATVPMSIAALSACADQSAGPTGPQGSLNLNVAPLTLPGVTGAQYDLWVTSAAPGGGTQTVWAENDLTSAVYGDGKGALTYIGTCDATAGEHTVHLKMDSLFVGVVEQFNAGEAQNPCPEDCQITAPCSENTDTLITYNLAIMRDADQGFFDIAVNFEDIFCSAKLDCQDALLHDASGNKRVPTVVLGFACTSGAETTFLHVNYGSGFDASGNVTGGITETTDGQIAGGGVAIYRDREELAGGFAKGFWNAAFRIDEGPLTVAGYATASQKPLPSGGAQVYNSFPVIRFKATYTNTCDSNSAVDGVQRLNQMDDAGANSKVKTIYVSDPAALFTSDVGGSTSDVTAL